MIAGEFPRRFGSYVLLKPLARGGMGELDLAVTGGHGMEKLCVIKRVLPHLLVADNVQRFREEAAMVMRLSHGNLVGVLDAGREQGQFYLAMDFVEGKDLLATWNQCAARRVAFPVEIAAYVIKELARGLGYAHAYRDLRLVHRDISPANVLLSYSGEIKLTDFGLAISKLKAQQTAPGIIYGKLAYLAPEQARGQSLDGRTDLYAAGILLWEMLTGQQLFPSKPAEPLAEQPGAPSVQRSSTLDALERVRNPVITPPASVTGRVPAELNDIVMRALAVDPGDRYQTGEEFRAELGSFLARHAPQTDAATLASFMTVLFHEEIEAERADRDALLAGASALLSGPTNARPSGRPGRGLVDPALWNSAPGARNGAPADNGAGVDGVDGVAGAASVDGMDGPLAPAPMSEHRGAAPDGTAGRGNADPRATTGAFQDQSPAITTVQRRRQSPDRRARPPAAHVGAGGGGKPGVAGAMQLAGAAYDEDAQRRVNAAAFFDVESALAGDGMTPPAPGDEDPRIGTTIAGRYYLRRLCGEGAMGRVYEGHHVEIGRRVAIKILHSNFRNTADVVERFRREARAASRIGHPNIVDVTDAGTTPDGAFFFVMEYLDGVDLEQVIAREGALPVERALLIAAQVCRALVGAHTAGIIHRDLKPANVMLVRHRDEDDFVKVLDFGISKQSELDIDPRGKDVGLTRPDAAVGTPIYMAPEQVAGHPADGRTDVYAVGELLFEMLTGVAPCSGNDIIAVFNKKANEDPPPVRQLRSDVPQPIEQMLIRAMSRLPAGRQASMADLKDEILSCLTRLEEAPAAGSPQRADLAASRTGRVWRPPSRTMWIAAAGLVAGLGLASMAVLWRTDGRGLSGNDVVPQSPRLATPPVPMARQVPGRTPGPATPTGTGSARVTGVSPGWIEAARLAAAARSAAVSVPAPALRHDPLRSQEGPANGARASGLPSKSSTTPSTPPASDRQVMRTSSAPGGSSPGKRNERNGRSETRAATSASPSASQAIDSLSKGRSAFAKGNFPEAVRFARTAVTKGDLVGGHLLLGDTFYKMDRYGEAIAEYEAVLRLAPGNERARRGRELATRRAAP